MSSKASLESGISSPQKPERLSEENTDFLPPRWGEEDRFTPPTPYRSSVHLLLEGLRGFQVRLIRQARNPIISADLLRLQLSSMDKFMHGSGMDLEQLRYLSGCQCFHLIPAQS